MIMVRASACAPVCDKRNTVVNTGTAMTEPPTPKNPPIRPAPTPIRANQPLWNSWVLRLAGDELPTRDPRKLWRSEEHTSELQSLMRISYAVFCLKKKNQITHTSRYKLIKQDI